MKKFLVLILVMSIALFTACGGEEAPGKEAPKEEVKKSSQEEEPEVSKDDKVVVEVLVPGYDSGYLKEQLDQCIAKYAEERPDVEIKIISAGWDELNSKVVQLYQAKQSPDIMLLGSRSLRQFSDLGVLEDLGQFITEEFLETRIPNVLETGVVNGVQYGIPMAFSSRALFYRSDIIDTPPNTWEELLDTAKKIAKEHNISGFAIPTDITSGTDELLSFIYQGGGNVVDEKGEFTINSPENIATFEYLAQFSEIIPDPVSTSRDDLSQLFVNDDLAMFVSGAWEIPTLDEAKAQYSIAILPEGPQKGVNLVTDSYVMSSISDNKEEAWNFIEFMNRFENQSIVTDAYQWFPVLKKESERDRYKEDNMKPFLDIIPHGTPESQVPVWDEFNKSFMIAIQRTLTGQATAKEALDTAQSEVSK